MRSRYQRIAMALVLLGFLLPAALYSHLPDDFPIHWDWQGDVDAHTGKPLGPFLLPSLSLLVYLMMLILPWISPREFAIEPFRRIYDKVTLAIVGFMFFVSILVFLVALGMPAPFSRAILAGLGVLLAVLGWLMPRFTRNFFAGIRTPWTLASDDVWRRTHSLGGKLFLAAGLITLGFGLVSNSLMPAIVSVSVAAIVPMAYSLVVYWQIENTKQKTDKPT